MTTQNNTHNNTQHADVATLVNICTEIWPPRQRTYFGSLNVRSPQSGEAFATTPIHGCMGVMDLGDKRTLEYRITAREIADDIAREINGDLDSAILDYERAIRFQPDHANAYFNRGDLLEKKGDPAQAIADLERYLDLGEGERVGDTETIQKRIENLKAQLPAK